MDEKAHITINHLATFSLANSVITKDEVEYILDNYSDTVFCCGKVRRICFDFITPDRARIYTEKTR